MPASQASGALTADPVLARYAAFEVGHDQVIIYDRETQRAWIQAAAAIDLADAA